MKVEQQVLKSGQEEIRGLSGGDGTHRLVLVFGSVERLSEPSLARTIKDAFPGAHIAGCSTCGEIAGDGSFDDTVVITSLSLSSTTTSLVTVPVPTMDDSHNTGKMLGKALEAKDLQYVLVLSDGLNVNGSELVRGLRATLGDKIIISGGLAGDGPRFTRTIVLHEDQICDKCVAAVGFYGKNFIARSSSASGWTTFGSFRTITKSRSNVLYEMDGTNALEVYSKYLGDEAAGLPSAGLLYPLALRVAGNDAGLIRTLLAVDNAHGSLTFAGDVPEGSKVCLMHAGPGQLIEGAGRAGLEARLAPDITPEFALLISCVGRKLVMGTQTDLEIEAVVERLPGCGHFGGFYSYGEIGFYEGSGTCELHNQTMTVTTMAEIPAGNEGGPTPEG